MEIELECVQRNIDKKCKRDCANCDLVLPDDEVVAAYVEVISMLKKQEDDLK